MPRFSKLYDTPAAAVRLMDQKSLHFKFACCLLLFVATLALYGRVKANPFIDFDDPGYLYKNLHVQKGLTWETLTWACTTYDQSNWHPLTWLSHALDYQLYGLRPAGHHLTSVSLHALNVVLLFLLLAQATRATARSFLVASLFAVHPFNVESVAWVAERKNVLSTLFFLLALAAYGWYVRHPNAKRYALVATLFALGLAAKPMIITLPFVLLLLDYWPLQRMQGRSPLAAGGLASSTRRKKRTQQASADDLAADRTSLWRLILEKLPLLVLVAASALLTLVAQSAAGSIQSFTRLSFGMRLENAVHAYALYVCKAIFPLHFAIYYPYPRSGVALWQFGAAIIFLLGVTVWAWRQRLTHRYLVAGWLWYAGMLVPVIGIIQVGGQAMADRYAYLPLVGIFVMTVWGIADWARDWHIGYPLRIAVPALMLILLGCLTWRQLGYWRSNYDLWSHAVDVTEDNTLAETNLGASLRVLHRPEDALPHFQKAASLDSKDPAVHLKLAANLAECGRLQDAIAEFQAAIPLAPDPAMQARTYESIAALYSALGDFSNTRENYQQALRAGPQLADQMISHVSQDVARRPTPQGYFSLAVLFEETGQRSQAIEAYQQALHLDPGLTAAKESLDLLGQ